MPKLATLKRGFLPLRHLFEQAAEAFHWRADVEVLLRRPDIGGDVAQHGGAQIALEWLNGGKAVPTRAQEIETIAAAGFDENLLCLRVNLFRRNFP